MAHAAGLDRIWFEDGSLILTGWTAGAGSIVLENADGLAIPPDMAHALCRPDVAAAHLCAEPPQGRLLIWRGPLQGGETVSIRLPGGRGRNQPLAAFAGTEREDGLERLQREYVCARGLLFDLALHRTSDNPARLAAVIAGATGSNEPGAPRGFIETARLVPGVGGLILGWCVGAKATFHLVDEQGHHHSVTDKALRWDRVDIARAFADEHGADCAESGFLLAWRWPTKVGGTIRLLARTGDDLILLNEQQVQVAPLDAVGFARWAFSLPVSAGRMIERLSTQDGGLLQELVRRRRAGQQDRPVLRRQAGPPVADPIVSIIVPLYGRADFIDHQLLEFADDPFIRGRCELLYVVDDPGLVQFVSSSLERWWQLYGVSLTMLWGGRNRGFSGANNLGLLAACGRQVLLLNSDVIPRQPGWLETLSRRLDDNPDYALLGARLLYPDGGLQHDGMTFEFDPLYGVWLNQHPGKGLAPPQAEGAEIQPWPAATGACLIGRRQEIADVGGLSEDYLIGDFEDSDLCLKLSSGGRRIGSCPDVVLTHLERQSFGLWGADEFRTKVMLFNAWQHQERWKETLAEGGPPDPGPRI